MVYKKTVSFNLDKIIERKQIKELYQSFKEIKSSEDVTLIEKFIADVIAYGFPFTKNMLHKAMVDPAKLAAFGCFLKGLAYSSVGTIIEMIQIPTATFKMGSTDDKDERPVREVTVSGYSIGKYPVANREYKEYLEDTNQEVPAIVADPANANHPVVNVSHSDGVKYCKWLSKKTGKNYHLPTEAQWELAARGQEGREYPWGNEFDASRLTSSVDGNKKGTEPVDAHPEGATPEGVMGLAGNVLEWVADWHGRHDPNQTNNPKGPEIGYYRVLRGGSWLGDRPNDFRGANRGRFRPEYRRNTFGFRVAMD